MELEELKASWNILNERLQQNEILNKRIIKEMITSRTRSAYERLLRFDILGLLVGLGVCILFPILKMNGKLVLEPLSFVLLEGILVVGVVAQLLFCSVLMRFDIEKKKTCELTRIALTYKLWMKRNLVGGSIVGMAFLISFLIIERSRLLGDWELRLTVILCVATIIIYCQIRFYLKNIRILEKGLEELKEFEEEPVLE